MTALIILAAGESSRLGFPKQTLLYKGKTLIELAIESGLKSKCNPVIVVLGANADKIEPGIKSNDIQIIHNTAWTQGMASSIRAGINYIKDDNTITGAMIMLCDQPFVNRAIIDSLLYKQQTGTNIVACTYKDTFGVPALFKRALFTELLLLQGQEGAKKVINNHPDDVATVPFEKGGIDIDTVTDYEELLRNA
ncbi:MAG: nucleotidyltransferase family protein [Mucilaginibacter sp.]|uniref:nucleotidyltransferase family protein n=1 Tax=Mucilaginibacter sp. TaxID=1882438 RepID=UPI002616792D|nr:nucleotidyltransferase family protein [Mucilaginibacter sp.]MDB5001900.1 nucleotidyltransferase family protein [Mucilaginibacter sp.]